MKATTNTTTTSTTTTTEAATQATTTTEATTVTEATTTEVTSDFITKHFTASTVAIDDTKSLSLYKLKDYNTSYRIDIANLTVYIETSNEVIEYLKTRLEATKTSKSQIAVQNWQSYYKPLQQLAMEEYKKIFASLSIKKQFELSCQGQAILISSTDTDNECITIKRNIFMRPIIKVNNKDDKKIKNAALNNELAALQDALLSDSNAKIKKRITNILSLWQYEMSWQSIDADGIKYLKNLGCLSGVKGNRHNQTKTTLLNKIVECVYIRRKRINTNNANNTDSTDKNNTDSTNK